MTVQYGTRLKIWTYVAHRTFEASSNEANWLLRQVIEANAATLVVVDVQLPDMQVSWARLPNLFHNQDSLLVLKALPFSNLRYTDYLFERFPVSHLSHSDQPASHLVRQEQYD